MREIEIENKHTKREKQGERGRYKQREKQRVREKITEKEIVIHQGKQGKRKRERKIQRGTQI